MNRFRGPSRRSPAPALMEEIEPRILFAADLAAFALPPAPGQDGAEVRLLEAAAQQDDNLAALLQSIPVDSRPAAQIQPQASQATAPATEWVVIDPLVPERDRLIADLQAQAEAQGRHFEVAVLDAQRDGLAQITELLAAHPGMAALHIVSHGSEGAMHLGSTQVDSQALAAHAGELTQWSSALGTDADILLYGCSIAAGADGQDFIARLAALTGADVAASTDLTGNAAAGGNWTLEYQSGQIEASSLVDQQVPSWDGVLAITSNGTSSSSSSTNTNTLTWAHTVASGTNRALFVELAIDGLGAPVTGVTYDGVAMTFVGRTSGNHAVEIWSLVNPTVGTANVVVNFGGNTAVAAGATTFNGVDQTSPTGTYVGAWGNSMESSVDVSSATGDLVIDVQNWANNPAGYAVGTGQSPQWTETTVAQRGTSTTEAGAASVTMSSTVSASSQWEIGAVSIQAAADPAPVNTVPGAQNTNEDIALVFASANGNAISITDADAGGANNEVTLSISNGTLTLAGTTGLTFTAGDGTADAAMTLRGTASAINTALNGLSYSPTANFNGGATLTLATKDSTLLSLDIDASLVGRYTFDNTGALGTDTSPAAGYPGAVTGGASVSDVTRGTVLALGGAGDVQTIGHFGDPTNLTLGAWVNLISADTDGAEVISLGDCVVLRLDQAGKLKGSFFDGTGHQFTEFATNLAGTDWHYVAYSVDTTNHVQVLYLDGTAVATTHYSGAIAWAGGANSFIGKHGNGGTTYDFNGMIDEARVYSRALTAAEIAALAVDQSLIDTDAVAITVAAVNDAPIASNLSTGETYTEDTALNLTNTVISDVDSANVTATLTLSDIAAGSLNTGTSGAVTSTYDAATGVWSASGALANVNTLLAGLTFTPASNYNSNFTIATSVSDSVATVTGSKVMTGTAVNDAPTASNLSAAETYTEDTALNLTDIVISDIDSANVTATLTLSNIAAGSLNTATSGTVTSTYDAGTGLWSASGALADVNNLLAGLIFTPTSNFSSSFTIATSVSDGVATVTGSKVMTGTANHAPSATMATAGAGLTLNTSGNDAYLVADNGGTLLGGLTALTIEAQVSLVASSAASHTLVSYTVASTDNEVELYITSNGNINLLIGNATRATVGTYTQLFDGTQHQVSASWTSATGAVAFYVDGLLVESPVLPLGVGHTITAGGTLVLGQDQDVPLGGFEASQALAGTLHDVRIFSDVRSDAEILADRLTTVPYNESGLVANWTFDDLSSEGRVMDTVAGNNLTVGHATGIGFTSSQPAMEFAMTENAANGTVVGTVHSTDQERTQRIAALLGGDARLRYSAETGQFYRVVTGPTTWTGAEAAARGGVGDSRLNTVTGQLVTIRSATENNVVLNLIQTHTTDIWLGGSDRLVEGDWRWYQAGSPADAFWSGGSGGSSGSAYAHWRAGEPNNTGGTEDSASMFYSVQPGYWNDTTGTSPRGYVIEWNADDVLDATNPLTYSIASQTISGAFTINSDTGVISVADGSLLDRETAASHSITVHTSDGTLTFDQTFSIVLRNVYEAPVITSSGGGATAAVSVAEGSTAVASVTARVDTTGTAAYSLVSGGDAARFSINASTGVLSFLTAPNYETPADVNGDNVYAVTVRVADGLGGTDTQALTVTVTNVNEAPVITSNGGGATAAISLAENTSAVTTVSSTDVDGGTPVYSISGGADAARFSINSNSGALSFTASADFENPADADLDNVYQVRVQVSDGTLADTQDLSITVTAVNDNAPVITSNGGAATAALSVAENGTAVTTVTATDADLPAATLVYSISGGSADAARFSINASTGVLSFVTATDYENPTDTNADNIYQVTVQVSDGSLTTTQALSITVTATNESAPVITSNGGAASASISMAENSMAVTTVTATDADLPAATLVYSITGGADAARFSINGSTGVLSFVAAPDFETPADAGADNVYLVTVQASDGSLLDTQALSITVTAVNESAPVITSNGGAGIALISVAENNTAVTTVTATDADLPAATLVYSITGGADAARFNINGSTGVLSFITAPDFETPADANTDNVYLVTVQASDGSLVDTQALSITVTAVNESAPVITSNGGAGIALISVAENNTAVTTVTATDADLPAATLVYSITGGADAARFNINGSTGVLSFITAPDFETPADANTDNVYLVTVQASDGSLVGTQALSITVTAINESAPVITSNGGAGTATLSVAENSTAVTTVTATDADLPAATLVYSITGGADAARFNINGSTGVLSFVTAPDFETPADANADNIYQVTVQASDGSLVGTQALSITVTAINESAPAITSNGGTGSASISVAENSTAVTTVTATDADLPVLTLVYRIAGGADAARFSIDSSTGMLNFATAPDYDNPADADADNVYQVTVQASDGSLAATQALSITVTAVNDNTPVITSDGGTATASLNLTENSTAVTTVAATDADLPASAPVYSITGGADAARFSIDGSTGLLRFATAPDYETPADADADNVYHVTVQASDGSLAATQALSITVTAVNDNAPVVTSNGGAATASLSMAENGTAVTTVTATDADLPAATLVYRIAGGADAARLRIDGSTGVLSFVTAPDFETPTDANADNVYQVTVQASDGSLATTQALSITVTAVNDNSPVITSDGGAATASLNLAENSTTVTTVTAMDADLPAATLVYSIAGGADAARFSINGSTGVLSFVTAPDFETPADANADNVYQVTVQASDGSLATTQALSITVTAVNDNTPVIASNGGGSTAVLATAENVTAVTTVQASDADQPAQTLTYSIVGGADAARLRIDSTTGLLSFVTAPDHEAPGDADGDNVYQVTVQASDGTYADTQTLTLSVGDVNDNAPVVAPGQRFVLAEISSNGAVLGRVLATDADSVASLGQWAISGGNIGEAFAIDPATGRITVANAGRLDYETTPTYTLRIRVSDGGLVSAEQTVTLVLTDVREPVPAPVPVPGAPEVTNPVPVFTVPGTAAAAPSPAPTPASSSPARGDAGDDTPEFALSIEFTTNPPSAVRSSQATTSSSGAVRRTASGELLSSVAGGTVSLDIDLVDLAEADSEGTGRGAPTDDTNRSVRVRAAQDGASRPAPSNDDLAIWAAKASAALLGAGFVWWSLRASGLLASLAASTPVWRHLDPIPILGGDDGTGYSTFDTAGPPQWDDEAARDEAASRELLDEARRNLDTVIS
jgi:hypothetical protein